MREIDVVISSKNTSLTFLFFMFLFLKKLKDNAAEFYKRACKIFSVESEPVSLDCNGLHIKSIYYFI